MLRRQNAQIAASYERRARAEAIVYSAAGAAERVRARVIARRAGRPAPPRPRVLWLGADENQDNSGWLAALRRHCDVVLAVDESGRYGQVFSATLFDREVIARNSATLLTSLHRANEQSPVDLVLGQMWSNYIGLEPLRAAQQLGAVTANVAMDDRLPEHWGSHGGVRLGAVGLCGATDAVFTTDPDSLLRYTVEGCPAFFFPLASDPELFRPASEAEKRYDISFVGGRYGIRAEIVDALERGGINVAAFGPGWANGPIPADRAAEIFGASRIVLGIGTIGHARDVYTIKLRDFDGPMSGALYMTHRNPDLLTLFEEGKEIECYASIKECVEKVRHYLGRPAERIAIAQAGLQRARRDHTWDRRITEMLNTLGLTP
jgi:hypothetical protein